MEFSFDDNLLIQNHLANWIQGDRAINKLEFSNDVNSIPELKEIVKNIGISKLIVKVRTERKKLYVLIEMVLLVFLIIFR